MVVRFDKNFPARKNTNKNNHLKTKQLMQKCHFNQKYIF